MPSKLKPSTYARRLLIAGGAIDFESAVGKFKLSSSVEGEARLVSVTRHCIVELNCTDLANTYSVTILKPGGCHLFFRGHAYRIPANVNVEDTDAVSDYAFETLVRATRKAEPMPRNESAGQLQRFLNSSLAYAPALRRIYDEMYMNHGIDRWAGVPERVAGVLAWDGPRARSTSRQQHAPSSSKNAAARIHGTPEAGPSTTL